MKIENHPLPVSLNWLMLENQFDVLEVQRLRGELVRDLPEVAVLLGIPQNKRFHPEIDTFMHCRLCLQAAEVLKLSPAAMLAVLLHDLGKGITPKEILPSHHGHEESGVVLVQAVCERHGVDAYTTRLCMNVSRWHLHCHPGYVGTTASLFSFLKESGLIDTREPDYYVYDFVLSCLADLRGRLSNSQASRSTHDRLIQLCLDLRKEEVLDRITRDIWTSPSTQKILREDVTPRLKQFFADCGNHQT